jgi:hypothetical protein
MKSRSKYAFHYLSTYTRNFSLRSQNPSQHYSIISRTKMKVKISDIVWKRVTLLSDKFEEKK